MGGDRMGAFEQISQFDLKVFQWFEDVLWNPVLDFIMALISFFGRRRHFIYRFDCRFALL